MFNAVNGIPLPYLLQNDTWVGILLILCTFLSGYLYLYYNRILRRELTNLFLPHKQVEADRLIGTDLQHFFLIEIQLALFAAILFIAYHLDGVIIYRHSYSSILYILLFSFIVFVALMFRNLLYWAIGHTFFSVVQTRAWFYALLLADLLTSFLFLAGVWILVYMNIHPVIDAVLALIIVLLPKALLIVKGIRIITSMRGTSIHAIDSFATGFVRKVYFIVYLCTLETIPLALAAVYLFYFNDFLNLN